MTIYNIEEVTAATKEYFKNDNLATSVWMDKYALKNKNGDILELTPKAMHIRMAKEFARVEKKYPNSMSEEEIYELFKDFKHIIPQGRVMAGLGVKDSYRSLSNCLVLPSPFDSYSSIMYTDTMLVNSAKRGCGYGIDLSKLRPKGFFTKNASNTSTGIIPFMERYSNSTREVGQEGRRGACLLGIDIFHPESMRFAKAKEDKTKITGANISLKVDDMFFNSVENNKEYDLKFENKVIESVNAKKYWGDIIETVHRDSEPGIFMWDRIINYDPVSVYNDHKIILSNACGEQPMGQLDTCRLIILNLFSFIENPFTNKAKLDEEKLFNYAYKQLILSDDLVDLEIEYIDRILDKIKSDPEPEEQKRIELELWTKVKNKAIKGRRVGCGLTGLGDMIAGLNLELNSKEALSVVDKVMFIKMKAELQASINLSKERGSFPDYDHNLEYIHGIGQNDFYKFLKTEFPKEVKNMGKYGRRNINWSTISPTGTTSLMTQTTSGCEPVFKINYKRRKKVEDGKHFDFVDENGDKWEEYSVFHHKFINWYSVSSGLNDEEKAFDYLKNSSEEMIYKLIKESPYNNSYVDKIDWKIRIELQSILQKYTTSAISSTVNLPKDVSKEEINDIYMAAWKSKCKGITIYREGSRSGVLLSNKKERPKEIVYNDSPKRPKEMECDISHITRGKKPYTVIVSVLKDKPYEIFAFDQLDNVDFNKSIKNGNTVKKKSNHYQLIGEYSDKQYTVDNMIDLQDDEAKMRTLYFSAMLQHGMKPVHICDKIEKCAIVTSFDRVLMKALGNYTNGDESSLKCPQCNNELRYEEACMRCQSCGYSKCG